MRKLTRLLSVLAAAAAAGLSACALGPNYRAPATPPTAARPFVSTTPGASAVEALPPGWWRLYQDPALDRLVQAALTENQDLKVAAANLDAARALLSEARGALLPSTTLAGEELYGRAAQTPGQPRSRLGRVYDASFDAAYEVDLFGRVRRSIEAARDNAQALQAAEDQVRVTVAAATAEAYAQACGFGEELATAQDSLKVAQQTYDLTLVQRNAGAVSDFDLARAGTVLEEARAAVPAVDGQRRIALFELAALLGRTPAEVPPEADACRIPPRIAQPLPVGDGVALLRRRPDVRQAERQLAASTARIGVATAALFPTISLGGSITDAAGSTAGLNRAAAVSFGVGPLISWTFPNISVARAQVRQSRAEASAALATFDSSVLQALKQAEQALTAYNAELARHAALGAAARDAGEAFRLANIQYQAGTASFLDLLTTQTALLEAQQNLAASDLALSADQVGVFRALGGGWEQAPPVKAPPAA
ncbi:MAG: efflux transporter outer membrane subunit [Phenylobacterium sp.]|nr:MAG: efflux transporter outer membrane subunit [Phenylobacterium sp.]